jgi:hypothetical protein
MVSVEFIVRSSSSPCGIAGALDHELRAKIGLLIVCGSWFIAKLVLGAFLSYLNRDKQRLGE